MPALDEKNIVILDNVKFHKAEDVINAIESTGAKVVYLPQYSPELNPIENCWSKLKAILKKYRIKTLTEFGKCLKIGLGQITQHDCESWFVNGGYYI